MAMFIHRRKVEQREAAKELAKKEQPKIEAEKEEVVTKAKEDSDITKEDVAKLPYFKLKSLAKSYGIDVEGKNAKALKAELMEKL